ncbi:zinc finger CCCH domain-containing protein 49 [Thecamonas trahens ATCC 50062]|uniref:Zinc finger CCCH domain-containing protein 49 n=1 Tax=Thecamonas trahens ATCC 50062 TaxID=461836 RepID=A0A0L0DE63_THETB|nr:zinc finger CCCH domain-containing protein 49 [Thecamonas trahens ATCC 50062]KNC49603.1 zinc finger CCCH domain-containing protein 49 [Thecamonas trahens ATCC 50062]|eukprot:XP_013757711.1 zinc finger CCCH domain-containing protein 49 [Thecamonas trahens ATCC 50062]
MAEDDTFPVLCEVCLGPNPYLKMTRARFSKECNICTEPYTVFRWRPGGTARFKSTVICQTCAKVKNVCQTCMMDLTFNLPVQVRDAVLAEEAAKGASGVAAGATAAGGGPLALPSQLIPVSDKMVNYTAAQNRAAVEKGLIKWGAEVASSRLQSMASSKMSYKRNRARPCTFFLRGECNRGDECPFRHEIPEHDYNFSHESFRNRYYGIDDPYAKKILSNDGGGGGSRSGRSGARVSHGHGPSRPKPAPPADPAATTLFFGGVVDARIGEPDLRALFAWARGGIRSISIQPKHACAFVRLGSRADAVAAIDRYWDGVEVKGLMLRINWAKPRRTGVQAGAAPPSAIVQPGAAASSSSRPAASGSSSLVGGNGSDSDSDDEGGAGGIPGMGGYGSVRVLPPPGATKIVYRAQDPAQVGSTK